MREFKKHGREETEQKAIDFFIKELDFSDYRGDLRLGNDEIVCLRNVDSKNLLRDGKLCLVLDLDHTLLNSTWLSDITSEEEYLKSCTDTLQGNLFMLESMRMLTKLSPFIHTFLKEAINTFEMYVYTMGERSYAWEMVKLLDPRKVYFSSRVISQADSTQRYQKGLDVVLGLESAVLILDDKKDHQFVFNCKSLSELKSDDCEPDGVLATILKVLQQIHSTFFDPVLKSIRKEVLKGCFRFFLAKFQADNHPLWKMAKQLGATCLTELDPSVTHVVATHVRTEKSRWAVKKEEESFLSIHSG